MGKKYKNPPVVEALCEFQFLNDQKWDITIPGIIYEKIKLIFPQKKQVMGFHSDFRPREGGIEQKVSFAQRIQFIRTDGKALVQVAENLISINHFAPYPTWNNFKPLILRMHDVFCDITKPKSLKRIGLRFVNKIEFEEKHFEILDYFRFYPSVPEELPKPYDVFQCRIEIPDKDTTTKLILNFGTTIAEKPENISVLLDLDYVLTKSGGVKFDEISDWLENAHTAIEHVYEACLTDKCRELFK